MSTLYIHNNKVYLNYSVNGKQIRKSLKLQPVNGKIPSEAKRIQQKIDSEVALGIHGLSELAPKPKKLTLTEFGEEYKTYIANRKAPTTVAGEKYLLKKLKTHFGESHLIRDISIKDADQFITTLIGKMSNHGVNWYIRGYRAMFNMALKWKYITENPFNMVTKLPEEAPTPRVLQPEELGQLIKTVETQYPHLADLFYFYLLTGCRLSEALRLEWSNIDFDKNIIVFNKLIKNHKPRIVVMANKVRAVLLNRKNEETPFRSYGKTKDDISPLFTEVFSKAEVKNASLKSLRSNFASHLASVGMEQSFNQKMLGHSDQVSKRHYINFTNSMITDKLNQVEDLLTSPKAKMPAKKRA